MVPEDGNLADTVCHDALRRTVKNDDLRTHLEDVLVARRDDVEYEPPETERHSLNRRVVSREQPRQFRGRITMTAFHHPVSFVCILRRFMGKGQGGRVDRRWLSGVVWRRGDECC